ncbi:MAG: hypothetical protein ACOC00_00115 [Halothiobacillaceae bacterium]
MVGAEHLGWGIGEFVQDERGKANQLLNKVDSNAQELNRRASDAGAPDWVIRGNEIAAGVIESVLELGMAAATGGATAAALGGTGRSVFNRGLSYYMASSVGRASNEADQAGLNQLDQAVYATTYGLAEVVPEMVGAKLGSAGVEDILIHGYNRAVGRGLGRFMANVARTGTAEVPQEWATGMIQATMDRLSGIDPEALTVESLERMIYDTAIASYAFAGVVEAPRHLAANRTRQKARSDHVANAVRDVVAAITNTETRAASPEATRIFMQTVAQDGELLLPSEAAGAMLEQPDMAAALVEVGVTEEQIKQAQSTGQDIRLPMADVMARLTPEQANALADVVRVDPAAMSRAEAEAHDVAPGVEATRVAKARRSGRKKLAAEIRRIQKEVRKTGGARQYAKDVGTIVRRMSERLAVDGREAHEIARRISIAQGDPSIAPDVPFQEQTREFVSMDDIKPQTIDYGDLIDIAERAARTDVRVGDLVHVREDGTIVKGPAPAGKDFAEREAMPDDVTAWREQGGGGVMQAFDQPAFHGTGNSQPYDRFSTQHVGGAGGEGAQAFGWGLYFTSSKSIAMAYRETLSRQYNKNRYDYEPGAMTPPGRGTYAGMLSEMFDNGQKFDVDRDDLDAETLAWLDEVGVEESSQYEIVDLAKGLSSWSEDIGNDTVAYEMPDATLIFITPEYWDASGPADGATGRFYQVDIPESDQLLQWDRLLDDQPEDVKRKLDSLGPNFWGGLDALQDTHPDNNYERESITAGELVEIARQGLLDNAMWGANGTDSQIKDMLEGGKSDQALSHLLNNAGIQGLEYPANQGRGTSRNFVIWNDEAVNILGYEQRQDGDARGRVEFGDDNSYNIRLFRNADLSTVVHELGHIYLNELQMAAGHELTATDGITSDWNAVRDWLGIEGDTITREQHEQFARAFEAYLREGEAPTASLFGLFGRFRRWLSRIYQDARQLNVELTSEVRNVFDRMLAGEAEVEKAAAAAEMQERTEEELAGLGLSPDDIAAINAPIEAGRQRAVEWLQRKRNSKIKSNIKQWRAEAKAQVEDLPVYRAIESIRERGGLDWGFMARTYGRGTAKRMNENGGIARRKGTLLPGEVFEEFGFENEAAMVQALAKAKKKKDQIDRLVQQRINEEDTEYTAAESLLDGDEYAQHLDALAAAIGNAMERTGQMDRNTFEEIALRGRDPKAVSEAMKRLALRHFQNLPVKDSTRVDLFTSALNRARRAESRALLKGNYAAALQANQQARVNLEFMRLSRELRERMGRNMRKAKRNGKAKPGTIDHDHAENIKALLHRYKIATPGIPQPMPDRRKLNEIVSGPGNELIGVGPAIEPFLLDESDVRDYRDMSVAEFQALMDAIDWLAGAGRYIVEQYSEHLRMSIEDAAEIAAHEARKAPSAKVYNKQTWWGRVGSGWQNFLSYMKMMQYAMDRMDAYQFTGPGGTMGWNRRNITMPLAAAEHDNQVLKRELAERLRGPLRHLTGRARDYPQFLETNVPVPEEMRRRGFYNWTFQHVVSIGLNMGTRQNRQALADGYSVDDIESLATSFLMEEDWRAIQEIWDTVDTLWPKLKAEHRKVYFYNPPKVEADPFEVTTADGKTIQMRGGYYSLKYDPSLDNRAEAEQQREKILEAHHGAFPPSARKGFTKRRVGSGGRPVRLSLDVLGEHIEYTTRFITHARVIRDIHRLIRHPTYAEAANRVLGEDVYRKMVPWLRQQLLLDDEVQNWFDRFVNSQRGNAAVFLMGLNPNTSLQQLVAVSELIGDIGMKTYGDGAKAMMDLVKRGELLEFMNTRSEFMRNRLFSREREVYDAIGKLDIGLHNKLARFKKNTAIAMLAPVAMPAWLAEVPAWLGAYNQGLELHLGNQYKASRYADERVINTQPAVRPMDLSYIQASKKGVHRLLTLFSTYAIKYQNRLGHNWKAWRTGSISTGQYLRLFAYQHIMSPIAWQAFLAAMWAIGGDDDELEDMPADLAADWIQTQFTGLPGINSAVYYVTNKARGQYAGSVNDSAALMGVDITTRAASNIVDLIINLDDDEKWKRAGWGMAEMMSWQLNVPVTQVWKRSVEGIEQYEETGNPFHLLVPDPDKRD